MNLKNRYAYLFLSALLLVISCASPKKPDNNLASVTRQDLGLQTNKKNYVYNYGDVVTDISTNVADVDVFIICSNCESTQLAMEIEMPTLSINVGTEPAVPTVLEAPEALTTFATSTTPIKRSADRTPWRNAVEPVVAPVQERVAINNPPVQQTVMTEKKDSDNTCLLGRVQFDLNDSTLKPEEQQKLKDKIIQPLKKIKNPIIHVHGYTCELGTKEYNDKLALNRAKEVAKFLESNGVKPEMVMGEGKCCYISDDLPVNRRAEITFINDASVVDSRLCEPRDKIHLTEVKKSEK
jgi:outer membrane protein OmpA-like peptidoglycan-associated protein